MLLNNTELGFKLYIKIYLCNLLIKCNESCTNFFLTSRFFLFLFFFLLFRLIRIRTKRGLL